MSSVAPDAIASAPSAKRFLFVRRATCAARAVRSTARAARLRRSRSRRAPELALHPADRPVADGVDPEGHQEQQRAEEKQHRVVRTAEHDLGQLGGDGRRDRAHRIGQLADTMAALPDAISTIIVSPTARPGPAPHRRRCPGRPLAAPLSGWSASAPRPAPTKPPRSCGGPPQRLLGHGEDDRDDGERQRHARTRAFNRDSRWKVFWNQVAMTISAKKPSTTDGMPARSSTTGLTISRVRGRAYCER